MLKDQQTQMDQHRALLELELSSAREELRSTKNELIAMRDENTKLKNELKELRSNLSRLALPAMSSAIGNGSGNSSTQPAPAKDATPVPPISDNTSNSSQDAAT